MFFFPCVISMWTSVYFQILNHCYIPRINTALIILNYSFNSCWIWFIGLFLFLEFLHLYSSKIGLYVYVHVCAYVYVYTYTILHNYITLCIYLYIIFPTFLIKLCWPYKRNWDVFYFFSALEQSERTHP